MILVGNQRGGARDLASHLMKDENDHVTLHELRGFIADDLHGAFAEAEAMSKGTRCRQFLFSMSFNPPETERVDISVFKSAINEAEQRLGLNNQPRAIVFHEKEGRRHAHAVWSRIKADEMKAVPLPLVIPPFLVSFVDRLHAAIFSFWAGVNPPLPILGRSLL